MSRKSLFVLGDSISIHYGPYLEAMLDGRFIYNRKTGDELALRDLDVPEGSNGGDSGMVLRYLEACFASGGFKPDIVMLNCGLHDIKTNPVTGVKQVPLADYKENLQKTIRLLTRNVPNTVWIRTTPVDDGVHNSKSKNFFRYAADLDVYNAAADAIMRDADIPAIDLYTFTKKLGSNIFFDHIHFNENVRELQAAFLAGYLHDFITRLRND